MEIQEIKIDGKKYIAVKSTSKCSLCDLFDKCLNYSGIPPCEVFNMNRCILKEVNNEPISK